MYVYIYIYIHTHTFLLSLSLSLSLYVRTYKAAPGFGFRAGRVQTLAGVEVCSRVQPLPRG